MRYPEAIQFLDSFVNYEKINRYRYAESFSLDRVRDFLGRLGDPQKAFPALHVAGTKGKGSTCAFAASILAAAGWKVGLYTSPHLYSFRERIQVNGVPISEEALAEVVSQVISMATEDLTYFEVTTACALLYFAQLGVDVAVVEVGMGGRLDATNLVEAAVTAVTPISLDHTTKLGDTLEAIAREKAGIIKPKIPVLTGIQTQGVNLLLEETARKHQAPLHRMSEEVQFSDMKLSLAGSNVTLQTPWGQYPNLQIPLLGRHQLDNAAMALRMVELFVQARGEALPSSEQVRKGLRQTQWPGRCHWIPGNPPVLLDGAQNQASAQTLKEAVQAFFPEKPITLIVGASQEKDLEGMAAVWGPWAQQIWVTQAATSRVESAGRLQEVFGRYGTSVQKADSVSVALDQAKGQTREGLVLVTGSLFIVAEALEVLGLTQPELVSQA